MAGASSKAARAPVFPDVGVTALDAVTELRTEGGSDEESVPDWAARSWGNSRGGCGGGGHGPGAGGAERCRAVDRALVGVREGALWPEWEGGVPLRGRSWFHESLLRRLREGVAAVADDAGTAGWSW